MPLHADENGSASARDAHALRHLDRRACANERVEENADKPRELSVYEAKGLLTRRERQDCVKCEQQLFELVGFALAVEQQC